MRTVLGLAIFVVVLISGACGGEKVPDLSLIEAIDQGRVSDVKQHMRAGTNPNDEYIPLGYPFAGAYAIHVAVLNENSEMIDILLEYGADIDIPSKDEHHATPLNWAAYFAIPNMVVLLVESGANIDKTDKYGSSLADVARSDYIFLDHSDEKAVGEFKMKRQEIQNFINTLD